MGLLRGLRAWRRAAGVLTCAVLVNATPEAPRRAVPARFLEVPRLSIDAPTANALRLRVAASPGDPARVALERSSDGKRWRRVGVMEQPTCIDSGLAAGVTYFYRARREAGRRHILCSNVVSATTPVAIGINDVMVLEGNSGTTSAVFTVALSSVSDRPVSVAYETVDGSATAADDDYRPTRGRLTIPPHTLTGTIAVPVVGDVAFEPTEEFYVRLDQPMHGVIVYGRGVGTILNDDDGEPPVVDVEFPEISPERLVVGTTVTLGWTATDNVRVDTVDLLLSRDHGATFEPLAIGQPNTGTWSWMVTGPATTGAAAVLQVRAHDPAGNVGAAVSARPFAIGEGISASPVAFGAPRVVPNPCRTAAQIQYWMPAPDRVRLTVVDLQGREVATIAEGPRGAGAQTEAWLPGNAGARLSPGMYFLRSRTGNHEWVTRFAIAP